MFSGQQAIYTPPGPSELQRLQDSIEAWSDPTFGFNRPPASSLHHLLEEVGEVISAPDDRMEWADCMMLFLDSARRAGLTASDLISVTYEKLEINKRRKWGPPNADGFQKHIET